MSSENVYDVVIIGSGPGGYVAGIRAGQLGLRTAVVEKGELGGVCLNIGCIPAKTLLRHAEILSLIRQSGQYGITTGDVSFDLEQIHARKDRVVKTLRDGVGALLKKNKVEIVRGTGRLLSAPKPAHDGGAAAPGEVAVQKPGGEELRLQTRNILLATGSCPRPLPGVTFDEERIVSTTGALNLRQVPRRFGVLGAGPGGVEFADLWREMGSEQVIVVEAAPRIIPREDAEMGALLQKSFENRGIRVETGARASNVVRNGDAVRFDLVTANGQSESVEVDCLLIAIGIVPLTDGLGLEEAGVKRDPRGFVLIDELMHTNVPGIYAIGDMVPTAPLANTASEEGILVVEQIAGLRVTPIDYDKIPHGVYCHPEVGAAGLTEEQARQKGYDVRVGRFPFRANGRALLMGQTEGLAKVVSEARYGEVLGIHIIGAEATTILGEAGLALAYEYTDEELGVSNHAHPTLSEIVKEAALAAIGRPLHISK